MGLGPSVGIEQGQRWRRAAAASELGGRLGFETPGVRLVTWEGVPGSLQEMAAGLTGGLKLETANPAEFQRFWDSQARRDMDAFDFLIGNQDRHPDNVLLDMSKDPPRFVLIDQDATFPTDARRGYEAQEPAYERPGQHGREFFVRDLPPAISADLAARLTSMHESFPQDQLKQWLTAQEIDGLRARLGILMTKLDSGKIRVIR